MTDRRDQRERLTAIEGADEAALGLDEGPAAAPPGAEVDATETRVPGRPHDSPGSEEKPWSTTLAAESHEAGVGNEPAGRGPAEDDEDR